MVDGSESMEDSDFMKQALVFIKKFVGDGMRQNINFIKLIKFTFS